jgi:hypothetical protein
MNNSSSTFFTVYYLNYKEVKSLQKKDREQFVCIHRHQLIRINNILEWQGSERGFIEPSMYTNNDVFWYHITENSEKDQVHFISKHPCESFAEFDQEIWHGEKLGAFWQQLTASQWLLTCFDVRTGSDCGFREMRLKINLECKEQARQFIADCLSNKY